jgi:endonuclease YncB( thermonuclease family)
MKTHSSLGLLLILLTTTLGVFYLEMNPNIYQDLFAGKPVGELYTVEKVVDADTLEVKDQKGYPITVQLLGVDAPEVNAEGKAECLADESLKFAERTLQGESVRLVEDVLVGDTDSFGRWLRYVYRGKDDLLVNEELIANGLGKEFAFEGQGYKMQRIFQQVQGVAQEEYRGVWHPANCPQ